MVATVAGVMTVPDEPVPRDPTRRDPGGRSGGSASLGAEPGLCAACTHAKVNETRRGTAYLRCLRAAWDERLSRYPGLPVRSCPGFEGVDSAERTQPG